MYELILVASTEQTSKSSREARRHARFVLQLCARSTTFVTFFGSVLCIRSLFVQLVRLRTRQTWLVPSNEQIPSESTFAGLERLADLRQDYRRGVLEAGDLHPNPFVSFRLWLELARTLHQPGQDEPHAMSLATADVNGVPSVRTVLLKDVDDRGFVWFTNYESRKGRELAENPRAALNFRWGAFERQVCVTGAVERVSASESDAYFDSRPLGSRIGAIVSAQSKVIAGRDELERAAADLAAGPVDSIRRPQHWGGFRLVPSVIEFWQGRPSRLHDRLRFRRGDPSADWILERLSP